jgi:hypothetical protein
MRVVPLEDAHAHPSTGTAAAVVAPISRAAAAADVKSAAGCASPVPPPSPLPPPESPPSDADAADDAAAEEADRLQHPKNWTDRLFSTFRLLHWLRHYSVTDAIGDVRAGLTVAAMVVPQSLAYANVVDLPPVHGLYASLLASLGYALFGTSPAISPAPDALESLMSAAALAHLWPSGSSGATLDDYIELVSILTLLVGFLRMVLGIFRFGVITSFLSHSVTTGYINAAALLIAFSQLKNALGMRLRPRRFSAAAPRPPRDF